MPIAPIASYPMPGEDTLPRNQVAWRADPKRAVLLLHDLQAYFLAPYDRDGSPFTELMANLVRIRKAADELGIPVVYTAQPGGMSAEQRGLLMDFWGPGMSTDDHDRQIVGELAPADGDTVLTKWRYSAFARSELGELITGQGRDQLIVCGIYAHVGCLMTAVEAFSADIQPFFVADAVADFSVDYHRLALTYAAERCAVVASTDQLLAMLSDVDDRNVSDTSMSSTTSDAVDTFAVRVSVPVALDPAAVFAYVTDLPRSGEWSPECLGGEWVSGEPAAVGSVFAARNRRSPDVVAWAPVVRGEWSTRCQVVESEAPRRFSWAMLDSSGNVQESVWTFEVEAGDGGSVLTHAFRMGQLTEGMRGILGGLDDEGKRQFVVDWAQKLEGDMRQSIERIRAAVEFTS